MVHRIFPKIIKYIYNNRRKTIYQYNKITLRNKIKKIIKMNIKNFFRINKIKKIIPYQMTRIHIQIEIIIIKNIVKTICNHKYPQTL